MLCAALTLLSLFEHNLRRECQEGVDETMAQRAFHGTTTVAFVFDEGIACAVDSRASMGSYVGGAAEKVIPLSPYVLGTMAGSAADCSRFLRLVSARTKLRELETGKPLKSPATAATVLAETLRRQQKGLGLSVGTMIMGAGGQLYYVDSDGSRIRGNIFAVGSGSTFAYSVLDSAYRADMTREEALELVELAVRTAANRDAYSGGTVNVFFVDKDALKAMVHRGLVDRLLETSSEEFYDDDNSTAAVEFRRLSNRTNLAFGLLTSTLLAICVCACAWRRP